MAYCCASVVKASTFNSARTVVAIRSMMYLALSYDHRVVDGVLGNRFLYRTARLLEEAQFEL